MSIMLMKKGRNDICQPKSAVPNQQFACLLCGMIQVWTLTPNTCCFADEPVTTESKREPISTDRPDFTESTSVVGWRILQIEAGYTFTKDRENDERWTDHTAPELLLRIGIHELVEFRLGWDGYSTTELNTFRSNDNGRSRDRQTHIDGSTDLLAGFKFHLIDQDGGIPDLGVIVETTIPIGTREKTSGDVEPEVKWLWAYDLTERWSIAGNINFAVPTSEDGRFFQTASSVAVGYAVNDWLGAYVEYFGFYPGERGGDCTHYANGGLTFGLNPDVQFDVRAGWGLNEQADDFFAGIGMACRINFGD